MSRYLRTVLATAVAVCAIPAFGLGANASNYRLTQSRVVLGGGLSVSTHYQIIGSVLPTLNASLPAITLAATQPGSNDDIQGKQQDRLATELSAACPNPCPVKAGCRISYSLAQAGRVSLGVYDLSGKLVSSLVRGTQKPGRYAVTFNPNRAARGGQLPLGVYFMKFVTEDHQAAQKLVLR